MSSTPHVEDSSLRPEREVTSWCRSCTYAEKLAWTTESKRVAAPMMNW
ncbi:hypothetical protein [Streptomyces sp. 1222.5]